MSGKRRTRPRNARARAAARPASGDPGAAIAAIALLAVLFCSGLLVDSGADEPFEAPKRLVALVGIAAAAIAVFALRRRDEPRWPPGSPRSRAIVLLAAGALALAVVSSVASPRRAASLDTTRVLLLTAILLPLGASRALERRGPLLLGAFLAIAAVDAIVSILQACGLYRPFPLETRGAREATGAFVGNVGYLALLLAFAGVCAAGVTLLGRGTALRIVSGILLLLFLAALLVNQNLTSLSALAAGAIALLLLRYGPRALLMAAGALAVVGLAAALYAPTRQRGKEVVAAVRAGDWDRVLTYRLGPWAAAREMVRDRPLLGWGPGTFEAEFVPHRLRAEIAARRRYVNPLMTSSYAEAHSDYVQAFAEIGIPGALMAVGAVALLGIEIVRTARAGPAARAPAEAILVAALLAAGAASALTWFPLQRPVTSVPLLLAVGRAWRICRPGTGAP